MDDDEETQGTESEFDDSPGDGENADTSATGAGSGNDGQQPPAPTNAPPGGGQKLLTQEEVNAIVQRRLAEDRARRGAAAGAGQPRRPAGGTPRPFDPETKAALDAYVAEQLAPLRESQLKVDMDRAFTSFSTTHPEFGEKAVRDEVIKIILDWGENVVNTAPMDWLLSQAWLQYKYSNFDEKKFRETAIQEFVDGKAKQARSVPTPQGSGGKAAAAPRKKGDTWRDTDQMMKQLIEEESSARQ